MPGKFLFYVYLIFVIIFSINYSYSQSYHFKTYSIEEGLPQSQVFSIIQDKRGKLWVGTNGGGVAIFDGARFKTIDKKDGLVNAQVRQILEDKKGNIWITTVFGLSKYDGKSFVNFTEKNGFIAGALQFLLEDKKGRIWNITQEKNYSAKFYNGGDSLIDFTAIHSETLNPENPIIYPFIGADSAISFVTQKGTYRLIGDDLQRDSLQQDIFRNRINFPFYDNQRNFWVATSEDLTTTNNTQVSKLYIRRKGSDKFELLPFPPEFAAGLFNVLADQKGNFWVVSFGLGIGKYDGQHVKYYNTKNGLPNLYTNIFEDKEGNIWLGSMSGGGLVKFSGETFSYFNTNNGLSNNSVFSILEDSNKNIWFAQNNNLSFFDGKQINNVVKNKSFGNLNRIIETKEKKIILASQVQGILQYKNENAIKISNEYKIDNNFILDIYQEKDTIWISSLGQGVIKYHQKDTTVLNIPPSKGIGTLQVNHIFRDHQQTLWFSTAGGIIQYKHDNDVQVFNEASNNLSSDLILQATEDKFGQLWFVTYGGGLIKYDRKRFEMFTTEDGLASNVIYAIIKDNEQNLWLGTQKGLDKIEIDKSGNINDIINYNKKQGFTGRELNRKSVLKDHKGNLWFGTIDGAVKYNPNEAKKISSPPAINISEIKIHAKKVNWNKAPYNSYNQGITPWNKLPTDLTLPYDLNYVSLSFEALNLSTPERTLFQWQLKGIDKGWSVPTRKREISYPNLPYGKYTFLVKSSRKKGVWSEKPTTFSFIILPPFWLTWWAKSLYIITFILSLLAFIKWRSAKLEREKNMLEQMVVERTSQLEQQKEEISSQAEKLIELDKSKSQFFANISHEFRTPLTLVLGPLERIFELSKDPEIKKQSKVAERNANSLFKLINQLLDLSKAEEGKLELHLEEKNIIPQIKNISSTFEILTQKKNIEYQFSSEIETLIMKYDDEKMEIIINNLLSNAIKFTPEKGAIKLDISIVDDKGKELIIKIEDSGIGISKSKQPYIFDRFYQVDSSIKKEFEGTGIGLSLTKELIELHKGQIKVESEEGKGTIFIITLPIASEQILTDRKDQSLQNLKETEIAEPEKATNDIQKQKTPIKPHENTILLVEDNHDLRTYIKEILEKEFNTIEAPNGADGLKASQENIPDLIISDIMMPQVSGIELCEQVKTNELTSHIPVILLTAKAGIDSKLEGLETGADDYLTKPFNKQELLTRVKNLITQRQKLRERFSKELNFEPKEVSTTSADERFLNKAIEVIEENMQNFEFSVSYFADQMAVSRAQLYKKLTDLTSQTPSEFNRTIRLKRAASLLKQKSGNISEVCFQVGFNNLNYFSRCFSKVYGTTPTEYLRA